MDPEGGRTRRPTQTVRHTCSGNLGIVKILRYIRSDIYTAKIHRKFFWQEDGQRCPVHNGKSGTVERIIPYGNLSEKTTSSHIDVHHISIFALLKYIDLYAVPDLPIGSIGLSLGPQHLGASDQGA